MASRRRMEQECQQKNQEGRMVEIVNKNLRLRDYWKDTAGRSFLINIHNNALRNYALTQAVCSISAQRLHPTIILNKSPLLESSLIQCANNKQMGRLHSISPAYKSYNLFYGLEEQQIIKVLNKQASEDSYADMASFEQYATAFLHIIQLKYPISYNAMVELAKLSDQEIAAFAASFHARPQDRKVFENDTVTGRYFREVLQKFTSVFSQIMTADDTRVSLANIRNDPSVYLLWAFSIRTNCFNSVIAEELLALVKRGVPFNLIINDINFTADDPLFQFIIQNNTFLGLLGICTPDAVLVDNHVSDTLQNGLCSSMGSGLIVRTQGDSVTHFETILKFFGTYQHYEVQQSFHRPQSIIPHPLSGTDDYSITTSEQPRISLADAVQFPVIVYGNNDEKITLYTGII